MTMTTCPECGHPISDKATTCPECGAALIAAPITPNKRNKNKILTVSIVAAALIAVALVCYFAIIRPSAYEARKTADCTEKARLIEETVNKAGVVTCKATYSHDVFRIIETYYVDYSLVMFGASGVLGPNITSTSSTVKQALTEMGYPEVSVIVEAQIDGITICTAKDGVLTS